MGGYDPLVLANLIVPAGNFVLHTLVLNGQLVALDDYLAHVQIQAVDFFYVLLDPGLVIVAFRL